MIYELRNDKGEVVSVGCYLIMLDDAQARANATGKLHSITSGGATLVLVPPEGTPPCTEEMQRFPYILGIVFVVLVGVWACQLMK